MRHRGAVLVIGMMVWAILLLLPTVSDAAKGVSKDEVVLGFIGDLSGPTVVVQKPYLDAVKNYFRNVNDKGGINGRKIKLIPEDDQYQPPKAVAALKKLVTKDEVLAIVGPTGSGPLKACYSMIESEKVPCIGPMSTTDDMLDPFKRYIFTIMSTYHDQVGVIFDYIIKDLKGQKPKVVLVTQQNEPGKVVEAATRETAKAKGVELAEVIYLLQGATDATSQVLLLKKADPNYVIIQGDIGVAVAVLKDAKKLGFDCKSIGTFSVFSEKTYLAAEDAAAKFVGVHSINAWYDEGPAIEEMRQVTLKYEPGTENTVRDRYYVQGWAAGTIVAEGLRRAGKELDSEKLVGALEGIKGLDMKGLCGPISYSPTSHKGLEHVRVYGWDFGKKRLVPLTDWLKPSK